MDIFKMLSTFRYVHKNIKYHDFDKLARKGASLHHVGFSNSRIIYYLLTTARQCNEGIQLFVQKELSDDMVCVDSKGITFDDIIWPANSVEFYFEDSRLPTCILGKLSPCTERDPFTGREILGVDVFDRENPVKPNTQLGFDFALQYGQDKDEFHHARIFAENTCNFLEGENTDKVDDLSGFMVSGIESEVFKACFRLCVNILLYISIPKYRAIPIEKKDLPKKQGCPGVKNRPKRPILKVIYVPTVINISSEPNSPVGSGAKKTPHKRRGHFRMLHSEKFTNKQGQLIYVPPCLIHGGSLSNKLFVARKVT